MADTAGRKNLFDDNSEEEEEYVPGKAQPEPVKNEELKVDAKLEEEDEYVPKDETTGLDKIIASTHEDETHY
jgi:hypothetical protein